MVGSELMTTTNRDLVIMIIHTSKKYLLHKKRFTKTLRISEEGPELQGGDPKIWDIILYRPMIKLHFSQIPNLITFLTAGYLAMNYNNSSRLISWLEPLELRFILRAAFFEISAGAVLDDHNDCAAINHVEDDDNID